MLDEDYIREQLKNLIFRLDKNEAEHDFVVELIANFKALLKLQDEKNKT